MQVELRLPGGVEEANCAAPEPCPGLDATLYATIDALTRLDADRLESLAQACERMTGGVAAAEAYRALDPHRLLGCLLEQTRRNLELLARITERSAEEYPAGLRAQF